jgi:hypothetical protein
VCLSRILKVGLDSNVTRSLVRPVPSVSELNQNPQSLAHERNSIVYDTLGKKNRPQNSVDADRKAGEQGLQLKFPVDLDKRSLDEACSRTLSLSYLTGTQIKSELKTMKASSDRKRVEDLVRATNRLTIGVDARSLFDSSRLTVANRVGDVNIPNIGLRHTIQASYIPSPHKSVDYTHIAQR